MIFTDFATPWLLPVIALLIGGLLACLIPLASRPETTPCGERYCVSYNRIFKLFLLFSIPFMCGLIWHSLHYLLHHPALALVILFNALLILLFYPYQVFLVKLSYDQRFIYYSSPLCEEKKIPWLQISEIGYSWVLMSDYIKVRGIGRIWVNSAQDGYATLMQVIQDNKNPAQWPG